MNVKVKMQMRLDHLHLFGMENKIRTKYSLSARASLLGLSDKELFAGYCVIPRGGSGLSIANKHQIQQIALLLNEYESL
ncbi:hypothetical protein [Paenibacillus bouchesdurhonensis]|uniref:hypothetical protein n=1 Tax=Paenibacillus bouchesdurhonensis TaxID=1870990 RepID=UPI001F1E2F17|nr:hypothetical protein [Paenibacillus bouchesdurhonensis]